MTSLPYKPSFLPLSSASLAVSSTAKMCGAGDVEMETSWIRSGMNAPCFSESAPIDQRRKMTGTKSLHS